MTRAFDQSAISSPTLFDSMILDIRLEDIQVHRAKVKEIRRQIVTGHYSGVMPDATQEAFAGYVNGVVVAAVAYGPGGNSKAFGAVLDGFDNSNARELIRLWVHPDAPKNTASLVLGKSLKMLPKEVGLVVSFADSGQNHYGYVYQATNFFYLGMSSQGIRYKDRSGTEVTSRLANIYKIRNPEKFGGMTAKGIREELGWSEVVSHAKHRYSIGAGSQKRKINKLLKAKSQPYPKPSKKLCK